MHQGRIRGTGQSSCERTVVPESRRLPISFTSHTTGNCLQIGGCAAYVSSRVEARLCDVAIQPRRRSRVAFKTTWPRESHRHSKHLCSRCRRTPAASSRILPNKDAGQKGASEVFRACAVKCTCKSQP